MSRPHPVTGVDGDETGNHELVVARERLEERLDRLLAYKGTPKDNRRFKNHLAEHRDHTLNSSLCHEDIDATNRPAEQAI